MYIRNKKYHGGMERTEKKKVILNENNIIFRWASSIRERARERSRRSYTRLGLLISTFLFLCIIFNNYFVISNYE